MKTGFRGAFVISWSQTEIDGIDGAPVASLTTGAAWMWNGDVVQIDGASAPLRLDHALGADALRKRAAQMVHRLVGAALDGDTLNSTSQWATDAGLADSSFIVTDGAQSYTVTVIHIGRGAQPLLLFLDAMPPRNTDLWVVHHTLGNKLTRADNTETNGVICFAEGTRISTPRGPIPVEDLRTGDPVSTQDNGAQPILWIGRRHITGARLFAMPHLRPVRIKSGAFGIERPDQEFLVSPDHRLLVTGHVAQDLFNTPEVLVAAKDLVDGRTIVTDVAARCVTYIHLLLPHHNIIWANGVATESFHPASADFGSLDSSDRTQLLAQMSELATDPHAYGDYARRSLNAPEAALLRRVA